MIGHVQLVRSVAFSPLAPSSPRARGTARCAFGTRHRAKSSRFWKGTRARCIRWPSPPTAPLVASGSRRRSAPVGRQFGQMFPYLACHWAHLRCVRGGLLPDGAVPASGSLDSTIRLWDPTSGKELRVLHGHLPWYYRWLFSPQRPRGCLWLCGRHHPDVGLPVGQIPLKVFKGHPIVCKALLLRLTAPQSPRPRTTRRSAHGTPRRASSSRVGPHKGGLLCQFSLTAPYSPPLLATERCAFGTPNGRGARCAALRYAS